MKNVSGDVVISFNKLLVDLSGLDDITVIGGDLILDNNTNLMSLCGSAHAVEFCNGSTGLSRLTSVGGSLHMENNDHLVSLKGLTSLSSVGLSFVGSSSLRIVSNSELRNLTGLSNLTAVPYIYVASCLNMVNLYGIGSPDEHTYVDRLELADLDKLETLSHLQSVIAGKIVWLSYLPELLSLDGLNTSAIAHSQGRLRLHTIPSLSSLSDLSDVKELLQFEMFGMALSNLSGLESLEVVTYFTLSGSNVRNVRALSSFTSVTFLYISFMSELRNLEGMVIIYVAIC